MSNERCPTCGQHVGHAPHPRSGPPAADEIELETLAFDGTSYSTIGGAEDPWPGRQATAAPKARDTDRAGLTGVFQRRPILGLFLAAAAVFGGLQVLDSLIGSSGPSNVLEEAGPEEVAQPTEGSAPQRTSTSLSDSDRTATAVAETSARAFERAAAAGLPGVTPYVVTYRTNEGLLALTGTTAFRSEPKLLALYNEAEGFSFLPSSEGTWAVNPDDPTDSFLVSYSSEVVASRTTGRHVYVDTRENGQRIAGVIINGVTGPFHEIPAGSEHLLVPDLGVLITPPTGGTVLLESTTIDAFSNGRVVAATSEAWVVQRCDESLTCTLSLVEAGSDVEVKVPSSGHDSPPFLSPDGTLLLYRTDGAEDFIYRADNDTAWSLQEKIDPAAEWSPDGRLLAWIDGSDLVTVDASNGDRSRAPLEVQPIAPSLLITMDPAMSSKPTN